MYFTGTSFTNSHLQSLLSQMLPDRITIYQWRKKITTYVTSVSLFILVLWKCSLGVLKIIECWYREFVLKNLRKGYVGPWYNKKNNAFILFLQRTKHYNTNNGYNCRSQLKMLICDCTTLLSALFVLLISSNFTWSIGFLLLKKKTK